MLTIKTELEKAREDVWAFRHVRKDTFAVYLERLENETRRDERELAEATLERIVGIQTTWHGFVGAKLIAERALAEYRGTDAGGGGAGNG